MPIFTSILQLVGRTPMVELARYSYIRDIKAILLAKLEYFNPGGSVKDRVALAMINDAERTGRLLPGGLVVEPTSGNTGIGLAMVCAAKGYKLIITMPDTMSIERRQLMAAYGAEIVLTPGAEGMTGAIAKAREICATHPGAIIPSQFDNPANPAAHYNTTAEEIIADCGNHPADYIVAGVGTGGTISGIGRRLKEVWPNVKVIAVEPAESAVLSGGQPGKHVIQGIGAGFVPGNFDRTVVDEIFTVPGEDARRTCRELGREEGILVGVSSGAALCAASHLAHRPALEGKCIVVIMPDSGERYLSTNLFA